jgi:oligoendopeptidase F
MVISAVAPLGKKYQNTLKKGLTTQRWVDRYETPGKRSGAFSSGGYTTLPYILLNYKTDSPDGVYTLAHEGGHSMHTLLSAANQPFPQYNYTIFAAEVASTFNEQLLTHYLLENSKDKATAAYITGKEINQIRNTIIRQTMFAAFEKRTHEIARSGEALSAQSLTHEYSKLLKLYFGKDVEIDQALQMEWARIPHFYSAFYVYKYATGLAAAISLSQNIIFDSRKYCPQYLNFLKSGGSDYPLDLLKKAGVDLATKTPVQQAMNRLDHLIDRLYELLN